MKKFLGFKALRISEWGKGLWASLNTLNKMKVRQRNNDGMSEQYRSQPSFPSEEETEDHRETFLSKFTAN